MALVDVEYKCRRAVSQESCEAAVVSMGLSSELNETIFPYMYMYYLMSYRLYGTGSELWRRIGSPVKH